jgi:hypothetical protein
MSIVRTVLRMSAVYALHNATWADDRVYDSDNRPLVDALTNETQPYITVYTDEDVRTDMSGRDIYQSTRSLILALEFGVAATVTDSSGDKQITIPATDEGMEVAVDILESQILNRLFGNVDSPWHDIIQDLVLRVVRIRSPRSASAERGARWAARQLSIQCDVISDPIRGLVLRDDHPIMRFIALAMTQSPTAPAAQLISNLLGSDIEPDWHLAQAWLGLTDAGVRSMGIAPLIKGDHTAPQLVEVDPAQEEWEYPVPSPED